MNSMNRFVARSLAVLVLYLHPVPVPAQAFRNATEIDGVSFSIDKRIELFHAMSHLANIPLLNGHDFRYKREIDTHFSELKNHHTILNLENVIRTCFRSIDEPYRFLLQLSPDLERTAADAFSSPCADTLATYLRVFRHRSRFDDFFEGQSSFYDLLLQNVEYNFRGFDERGRMETYFGVTQDSYAIILNLLGRGNFGIRTQQDGESHTFCVLEPEGLHGDIPVYSYSRMLNSLIWHEFGHSFCNPLFDRFSAGIQDYGYLYEPIQTAMSGQAYQDWTVTVKEHLVRAATIRLAADKYGEDLAYLHNYRVEMGRSFIYVKPLCKTLKRYETDRVRYASFENFFPELIETFGTINEDDVTEYQDEVAELRKPDVRNIPIINDSRTDDLTMILPTGERDGTMQERLREYVCEIQSRHWPHAAILEDTEALEADLMNSNLIVYGTMDGNRFLRENVHRIPIRITEDSIIADRDHEGSNLRLIVSWINPSNVEKTMRVYTAQKTEDVLGINSLFHGPTNYVIGQGSRIVASGNFVNRMKIWFCE